MAKRGAGGGASCLSGGVVRFVSDQHDEREIRGDGTSVDEGGVLLVRVRRREVIEQLACTQRQARSSSTQRAIRMSGRSSAASPFRPCFSLLRCVRCLCVLCVTWSGEHLSLFVGSVLDLDGACDGLGLLLGVRHADQLAVALVLHRVAGRAHLTVHLEATTDAARTRQTQIDGSERKARRIRRPVSQCLSAPARVRLVCTWHGRTSQRIRCAPTGTEAERWYRTQARLRWQRQPGSTAAAAAACKVEQTCERLNCRVSVCALLCALVSLCRALTAVTPMTIPLATVAIRRLLTRRWNMARGVSSRGAGLRSDNTHSGGAERGQEEQRSATTAASTARAHARHTPRLPSSRRLRRTNTNL